MSVTISNMLHQSATTDWSLLRSLKSSNEFQVRQYNECMHDAKITEADTSKKLTGTNCKRIRLFSFCDLVQNKGLQQTTAIRVCKIKQVEAEF